MPVVVMIGGLALLSSVLGRDPFARKDAKAGPRPLFGVSMTLPRFPAIAPEVSAEAVSVQGQVLGIFEEPDAHEPLGLGALAETSALIVAPAWTADELGAWSPEDYVVPLPKQPTTIVVVADWIRRPVEVRADADLTGETAAAEPSWAVDDDDADVSADEIEQLALESAASAPEAEVLPQPLPYAPAAPIGTLPMASQPSANPGLESSVPYHTGSSGSSAALPVVTPAQGAEPAYRPTTVQAGSHSGPWPFHR